MRNRTTRCLWYGILLGTSLMAALARPAGAADMEWDGAATPNTWDQMQLPLNTTNWVGDTIPDADDTALFGDTAPSTELSVDLNGDREVLSVTFNRTLTGDYLLFDDFTTRTLTLGTGDITVLAGDPTIAASVNIDLSAQGDWSVADGHSLTVAGTVTSTDRLVHNALGTVEFTGTGSSVTGLRALGGGTVDLNGATFLLTEPTVSSLIANHGSELIIRGGSTVTMPSVGTTTNSAGRGQVIQDSTLQVTGSGSSLTGSRLDIGINTGNDARTVVEDSALLDITSGSDALLLIGYQANSEGTLTVQTGGDVQASTVTIAVLTDSTGTLTVNGTGSTLAADDIKLGGTSSIDLGGTGLLTVEAGGSASATNQLKFFSETSAVTVNGGTLSVDTLAEEGAVTGLISISDPVAGTALTVGGGGGSSTFNGEIQDAGSLKKIGTGTLTLNGANTYTGGTTISGGTVSLGNSSAAGTGPITVLGSTVDYANTINVMNGIDLQNDATLNVNTGSATQSGAIGETGGPWGITKTGTGTLTLEGGGNFTGMTNIDAGQIIMTDFSALYDSTVFINTPYGLDVTTHAVDANLGGLAGSGNLNIGSRNIAVGGNNDSTIYSGDLSGGGGTLTKKGSGTLTLTGANNYSGQTIIRSGTVAAAADGNLGNPSAPLYFRGGGLRYDAAFDLNASRTVLLDVGGGTFDTNGFDTTLAQAVTGPGGLTKTGVGTLTLTGANFYFGGTTINGGTLSLGNSSAAGTGAITVLGSTIDYANTINVINAIDLQNDATLNVNTGSATQSGVIGETGGPWGVAKTGAGTLTLTGANTFSGGLDVSGGAVSVAHDLSLTDLNVAGGTTLDGTPPAAPVATDGTDGRSIVIANNTTVAGLVSFRGGQGGIGSFPDSAGKGGIGGSFQGSNTILSGSGEINLNGGGGGLGDIILGGNGGAGGSYAGGNTTLSDSAQINANGGQGGAENSFGPAGSGGGGGSFLVSSGNVMLDSTAQINVTGGRGGTGDFETAGNGGGGGSLNVSGGTLTFNGSAQISIDGGQGGNGGAFASGGNGGTGGSLNVSGGILTLNGSAQISIDGGQGGSGGFGAPDGSGGGGGQLTVSDGSLIANGGAILLLGGTGSSDGNNGTVTVTDGDLTLSGGSMTTGSFDFSSGTGNVLIEDDSVLTVTGQTLLGATANAMTIDSGSLLTDTLSGPAAAILNIADPTTGTALTVGTNNGSSSFDGAIDGAGSISKVGTGSLTLTGANTYSGGTLIDEGTLLANNTTGSATGSGAVQVNSGGTLGGTGSVAGAVTVDSSAALAPGASVGQLTVDSVLLNSGSTFAVELAGSGGVAGTDFDQLLVTGTATLGGDLTIDLLGGFIPLAADSFTVLTSSNLSGSFDNVANGARLATAAGTADFLVSYDGTTDTVLLSDYAPTLDGDFDLDSDVDGSDFLAWQRGESPNGAYSASDLSDWETNFGTVLPAVAAGSVAVPEPTTAVLSLAALCLIMARRRSI